MKRIFLYAVCFFIYSSGTLAEDLIMVRSTQAFPETMLALQQAIREQGYDIARVQRVDVGLTAMGYQTDKYRVVFFGKAEEVTQLTERYPRLIPYLPQKISLFAENDQTILLTANPIAFKSIYTDADLAPVFDQWEQDLRVIMRKVTDLN